MSTELAAQELSALLDVQDIVTFRWYAQQMELPVETAKEELKQFCDNHRGKVHAVYLLGGGVTTSNGERRRDARARRINCCSGLAEPTEARLMPPCSMPPT